MFTQARDLLISGFLLGLLIGPEKIGEILARVTIGFAGQFNAVIGG